MRMIKQIKLVTLILTFWLIFTVIAEASGLSTTFSKVTLEGLEIGKSYSAKETAGLPLTVINTGEESIDLKIEVILPETHELGEGFEAIPDISWIKLEQDEFRGILPNASAITDVVISIPDDARYIGKKYQFFLWSHTTGRAIGVGLKSKLLFSVEEQKKQ